MKVESDRKLEIKRTNIFRSIGFAFFLIFLLFQFSTVFRRYKYLLVSSMQVSLFSLNRTRSSIFGFLRSLLLGKFFMRYILLQYTYLFRNIYDPAADLKKEIVVIIFCQAWKRRIQIIITRTVDAEIKNCLSILFF